MSQTSRGGDYKELQQVQNSSTSNPVSLYVGTQPANKKRQSKMTLEGLMVSKLRIRNVYVREFMAELLGTFLLVGVGIGCNAQHVLSKGTASSLDTVYLGWSVALMMGVFASGTVSGGHLNPAVTLTMSLLGKLPWKKLPIYCLGQFIGALIGSACIFGVYHNALDKYDVNRTVTGPTATAGIWATYPSSFLTPMSGLGDQVFGTMLLLLCILAITDSKNVKNAPFIAVPISIGLILLVIGQGFAFNCGYALNPARDLAPRIFTAMAGYGGEVFSAGNYLFWIPIVGPLIGAVCGAFIYLLLVGIHLPDEDEDDDLKGVSLKALNYVQTGEQQKEVM